MSVLINNTEELLHLVRKLGLKITSVEDLERLLKTINASYNPEADRIRLVRRVGLAVPIIACIFAALATGTIAAPGPHGNLHQMEAVAVVWGCTALICLGALAFSFFALGFRRSQPSSKATFLPRGIDPLAESSTAITDRLGQPGDAWQRG